MMQSQCPWTPCKMPMPLSFKPSTFSAFSFSKQLRLHRKSIASIVSTRRGIASYPSLMASSPSVSTTQKDAFSTQNDSTRKTQQPLQVPQSLFISLLANFVRPSLIFDMGFVFYSIFCVINSYFQFA